MKFIHLSDLHLGLKLFNYDLIEEQRDALAQIVEQVKQTQPDAVVVAGDVYDKSIPSADALELFDDFLNDVSEASAKTQIMTISGNHDSAPRLDQYRRFLSRMNVHMVGLPPRRPDESIEKVAIEDEFGVVNFYLLPFVKPTSVKEIVGVDEKGNNRSYEESLRRLLEREYIDPTERNVLVSHQFYYPGGQSPDSVERMESETYGVSVGNVDAVSSDLLSAFDYAALGHIHKPWSLGGDPCRRYCGTPYPYSVDEQGQKKGSVLVELFEKGAVNTSVLPITPLRAVRTVEGLFDDVLKQGCDDYVRVVLTDPAGEVLVDVRERLLDAFPRLLEIRRKHVASSGGESARVGMTTDPMELCRMFLGELTLEDEELLQDVVNSVKGVE